MIGKPKNSEITEIEGITSVMKQCRTIKQIHKGRSENIFSARGIVVSMKWDGPADFDLAAVCADKKGNTAIVYSGDSGNPNQFPWISFYDGCFGDITPYKEEAFSIRGPQMLNHVWILCWEYEKIQKKQPAEFKENHLSLTVTDSKENIFEIYPDNDSPANIALLAAIDNSGLLGTKLISISHAGMFKELKHPDQLMDFVREGQKAVPSSHDLGMC